MHSIEAEGKIEKQVKRSTGSSSKKLRENTGMHQGPSRKSSSLCRTLQQHTLLEDPDLF
jgi:hypothetical protein